MKKISVIIATHDRSVFLKRALLSLLSQTYQCHQIIIISDVIDFDAYQVIFESMRLQDIFIQRLGAPGPAESRNMGMRLVTGDFFIFLDDDDTFQPNFIFDVSRYLDDPLANEFVFYTNFEVVSERLDGIQNEVSAVVQSFDIGDCDPLRVYVKNFIPNNCLIFPSRLIFDISFDPGISYEDWDFILEACGRLPLKHLPTSGPRIHKNTSEDWTPRGKRNDSGLLDCYLKIYAKHPPPNQAVSTWRKDLFLEIDLNIEVIVCNEPLF